MPCVLAQLHKKRYHGNHWKFVMKQLAKCQNVIINKYILTILSFSGVQQSLYRFLIHPSATTFCLLGGAYCSLKHFLIYLACVFPLPSLCFSYVSLSLLTHLVSYATGCSLNSVFFSKNSRKFATSPALGCRRGRGCSELWKTQFFLNTLYHILYMNFLLSWLLNLAGYLSFLFWCP